jgi:hypothetical protein
MSSDCIALVDIYDGEVDTVVPLFWMPPTDGRATLYQSQDSMIVVAPHADGGVCYSPELTNPTWALMVAYEMCAAGLDARILRRRGWNVTEIRPISQVAYF